MRSHKSCSFKKHHADTRFVQYGYGAAIAEDRTVAREKYSEAKLEANFLMTFPAYLTATPMKASNDSFADTEEITITQLKGSNTQLNINPTAFYIVRRSNYTSLDTTHYRLTVSTGRGIFNIPQLSGTLTLNGRDSKVRLAGPIMHVLISFHEWRNLFKNYLHVVSSLYMSYHL